MSSTIQDRINKKSDGSLTWRLRDAAAIAKRELRLIDHDRITIQTGETSVELTIAQLFNTLVSASFEKHKQGDRDRASEKYMQRIDTLERKIKELEGSK